MDFNNIDTARSYATEAQLAKGLERFGLTEFRPLVVRNRAGRWTAVFPVTVFDGNVTYAARLGFHTIG